ncbi:beta-ketoacyl-ACP synthase III [Rickettsiales endosymbiont of Trichoplax sp. H2]|uniref:beta-ketoacyl-ACP synthase III n=1 Tax=Rickettsiales endosymbiont of Trichoplax sp. H2 TaxID=2021221 RepID=UPI0012B206CF|nr:beta-ketoacyl-ACP synthase III [Rickettsiales endosymbiont of Trichoplax sp. H2]MSO13969.1 3-oxoacyl-[acyl-carrier-protein] synthase 3 [Rickettsiales endosymbiont of Trichoplax sp. H2]
MTSSKIIGVGSYLPDKILTNNDLEKIVDTSDEWIQERTGIKKRHIAGKNQLTSDLATIAVKNALKKANISANNLDAIIIATTTPDLVFPATAVKVQNNIGMQSGFAFDVQAVCSGFLYALQIADSLIISNKANRVAVIGAETMSRIIDWQDRSTCVLFGDGAGAVILEKSEDKTNGILDIELFSDGKYQDILIVNGGVSTGNLDKKITMNGREVFRYAVTKMPESIEYIITKNNLSITDIDWVLLHQANQRIIKSVMERLNISTEKAVSTVANHANTSAASIPLALDQYVSKEKIKSGELIALSAVGGGLTWGSALIKI